MSFSASTLRCLFLVQGEGRGHLTQALALRSMLADAGHTVARVLVGHNAVRTLPAFFLRTIDAPVETFHSPAFAFDAQHRGLRLGATAAQTLRRLPAFRGSLRTIDACVRGDRPDVLINFFEPLGGVYNQLYRPNVPVVCIGHQYLFHHPVYPFPADQPLKRWGAQQFTHLTAAGAAHKLGLSFYPAPALPEERLTVVPPLLRDALYARADAVTTEDFFLTYVLNRGYGDEIQRWHGAHPDVRLHCFWDNSDVGETYTPHPNLTFHQLHDTKFLDFMARCRGVICTAGFESVCEAMYLGKPVLMVPVEGHFEQFCNAIDAAQHGAGVRGDRFDIQQLIDFAPSYTRPASAFRQWVAEGTPRFLEVIERVARQEPVLPAVAVE